MHGGLYSPLQRHIPNVLKLPTSPNSLKAQPPPEWHQQAEDQNFNLVTVKIQTMVLTNHLVNEKGSCVCVGGRNFQLKFYESLRQL